MSRSFTDHLIPRFISCFKVWIWSWFIQNQTRFSLNYDNSIVKLGATLCLGYLQVMCRSHSGHLNPNSILSVIVWTWSWLLQTVTGSNEILFYLRYFYCQGQVHYMTRLYSGHVQVLYSISDSQIHLKVWTSSWILHTETGSNKILS